MVPNEIQLSVPIRERLLSGRGAWCLLAFVNLGVATSLVLILTILHGLDMVIGFGAFMPQFNMHLYSNPFQIIPLMPDAVAMFDGLRGVFFKDPAAWVTLAMLGCVLFLAHYLRFGRLQGESMKAYPPAKPVVRQLLSAFGYFRDIQLPVSESGTGSNDFMAMNKILFVPKGHVSRILKGKGSTNQQAMVKFFMAHEYAHAVSRDNLATSAFKVVVTVYVFVALSMFSPLLLIGGWFLASTPWGGAVDSLLAFIVILLFGVGLSLSFHGLLVSYIKAREFFADEVAFHFVSETDNPYHLYGTEKRPDMLSAFSVDISRYERGLHKLGGSLHARNLLVFFWGVVICVRTLYVLLAPKEMCFLILGYDVAALVSYAIFFFSLPKRPSRSIARPALPYLVTFFAVAAVEICGPGLMGIVKGVYWSFFSNVNAQLIGLPGALIFLCFLVACLWIGAVKLIRWRRRVPRQSGVVLKRMGLRLVGFPGVAAAHLLIFSLCATLYSRFLLYFIRLEFVDYSLVTGAIIFILTILAVLLLYHQYKGVFAFHRLRASVVSLLEGAFIFLLFFSLRLY